MHAVEHLRTATCGPSGVKLRGTCENGAGVHRAARVHAPIGQSHRASRGEEAEEFKSLGRRSVDGMVEVPWHVVSRSRPLARLRAGVARSVAARSRSCNSRIRRGAESADRCGECTCGDWTTWSNECVQMHVRRRHFQRPIGTGLRTVASGGAHTKRCSYSGSSDVIKYVGRRMGATCTSYKSPEEVEMEELAVIDASSWASTGVSSRFGAVHLFIHRFEAMLPSETSVRHVAQVV